MEPTPDAIRAHLATLTPAATPFVLRRNADVTGISGTGIVADGVLFPDLRVATRWRSTDGVAQTCAWDRLAHVRQVHGHGGATVIEMMPVSGLIHAVQAVLTELGEVDDNDSPVHLAARIYRGIAVALDPTTADSAVDEYLGEVA